MVTATQPVTDKQVTPRYDLATRNSALGRANEAREAAEVCASCTEAIDGGEAVAIGTVQVRRSSCIGAYLDVVRAPLCMPCWGKTVREWTDRAAAGVAGTIDHHESTPSTGLEAALRQPMYPDPGSWPYLHRWGWTKAPPIQLLEPVGCEGCGRPITGSVIRLDRFGGRLMVCSYRCQAVVYKARARPEKHEKQCAHCGALFMPARTDARYCGSACRQASYRKRQSATNNEIAEEAT